MTAASWPRARSTVGLLLAAVIVTSVVAGGAVLAATTAGAQEGGAAQDGDATVRVVHASPDAPAVDVALDGETVLRNVSFGTVSDYLTVPQGTHTVTITLAGDSEAVVFDEEIAVDASETYTVAATGEVEGETEFETVILDDGAVEPDDDEAAVRLAHLSPDAPAVDVTVEGSGDVLVENASFRNASAYAIVPEGNYTLEVRPATEENDGEVLATFDVTVEGGTAYTAFAVGYVDAGNASVDAPFDLLVGTDLLEDESGAEGDEGADGADDDEATGTSTPAGTPSD